jgi:hypothetical protein
VPFREVYPLLAKVKNEAVVEFGKDAEQGARGFWIELISI